MGTRSRRGGCRDRGKANAARPPRYLLRAGRTRGVCIRRRDRGRRLRAAHVDDCTPLRTTRTLTSSGTVAVSDPPDKLVTRKCRWCGRKFKVPREYPKRKGCPECAPQLFATTA